MGKPYEPADRRPIASRSLRVMQWAADRLVHLEVSANTISVSSILFAAATLVIVLSANAATWRYRSTKRELGRDLLVTIGMLALGVLVCGGAYFLGAVLGLIDP